ncbi:hypothetical protein B0H14DRAFT_3525664 [Mycena olivaceomarginata]|nr:hypothetical protein B0H14DRAFT_3525664 [Mycena olivaceomarginata]
MSPCSFPQRLLTLLSPPPPSLAQSNHPTPAALWVADHPHDLVFNPCVSKHADHGARIFYFTIRRRAGGKEALSESQTNPAVLEVVSMIK